MARPHRDARAHRFRQRAVGHRLWRPPRHRHGGCPRLLPPPLRAPERGEVARHRRPRGGDGIDRGPRRLLSTEWVYVLSGAETCTPGSVSRPFLRVGDMTRRPLVLVPFLGLLAAATAACGSPSTNSPVGPVTS